MGMHFFADFHSLDSGFIFQPGNNNRAIRVITGYKAADSKQLAQFVKYTRSTRKIVCLVDTHKTRK